MNKLSNSTKTNYSEVVKLSWIFYIIFIFVLYSFFGWILEEVYSYFVNGKFKNEGFLSGPFKPMYGIAMCLTTVCYHVLQVRGVFMWILFFIIPTVVEYISGYLLKNIFHKEYWNYRSIKCNYKGLICLRFSIYWFILISISTILIEPIIYFIYSNQNNLFNIIGIIFVIYIAFDSIKSMKNGIELKRT